ncbi:MAG TPA: hypothetical protein DFS52_09950 [Myxococcales bacterium]|nr:hypothetical protein [Myxococcales bacterium]
MNLPAQIAILGASGDLTARKLIPALSNLAAKGLPPAGFSVVGMARRSKTDETFREELRQHLPLQDLAAFAALAPRIHYVEGDASRPDGLRALERRLDMLPGGREAPRLFYLSLKPELVVPAVASLAPAHLASRHETGEAWRRVIVEKPFGEDLKTARQVNLALQDFLREDQVYRIDHYLGKETVQNAFAFRFHNAIFEPLWNPPADRRSPLSARPARDWPPESGAGFASPG